MKLNKQQRHLSIYNNICTLCDKRKSKKVTNYFSHFIHTCWLLQAQNIWISTNLPKYFLNGLWPSIEDCDCLMPTKGIVTKPSFVWWCHNTFQDLPAERSTSCHTNPSWFTFVMQCTSLLVSHILYNSLKNCYKCIAEVNL